MKLWKGSNGHVPLERRDQSPENVARRKVFDEHEKKSVEMKQVHVESTMADTDRRLDLINANLRGMQRRGLPQ